MAKFNLRQKAIGLDWTQRLLRRAKSISPDLDSTKTSHIQFCKDRADHWLSIITNHG